MAKFNIIKIISIASFILANLANSVLTFQEPTFAGSGCPPGSFKVVATDDEGEYHLFKLNY